VVSENRPHLQRFDKAETILKFWMIGHWPIVILLTINLLIGLWIVRDYGISADEPRFLEYARQSLDAYYGWIDPAYAPFFGADNLRHYGPVLAMGTAIASSWIRVFAPQAVEMDIWHYSYFVGFQITGLLLYCLANRWFSRKTSFVLTALFLFQPLLWGHAFINPKDIPFLMAFTGSVVIGLWAVDKLPAGKTAGDPSYLHLAEDWTQAGLREKRAAVVGTVLWFLLLAVLVLGWGLIIDGIASLIHVMHSGENTLLARIFALFVSSSFLQPADNYILKAMIMADWVRVAGLALLALLVVLLYRPVFPSLFSWLQPGNIRQFLSQSLQLLRSPYLILAGVSLGIAISTRILGLWAGVVVGVYLIWRLRNHALPAFIVYGMSAIIIGYLTWPYLWPDPLARFLESLNIMANFSWHGKVLFDGVQFAADRLPHVYLPTLLSIQFTEPVLILFGMGLGIMAWRLYRKNIAIDLPGLFAGWALLPILIFIVTSRPMYDNFRQLLFLVPPFFLVAGLAIETIFQRFDKYWVMLAVTAILLIPSVAPLIRLHPYQYIYYNNLVGGVSGSAGRFENDYWATSYAESMRYVNQFAPSGAKVLVWTFEYVAAEYARPDLVVTWQNTKDVGYVVISSRGDKYLSVFPDFPPAFQVQREGVVLSVVKRIIP
jgi:hypothetical protein